MLTSSEPDRDSSRAIGPAPAAQVSTDQRVDAMDVLRGFALIGVLWMNIEWFNRPVAELPRMDVTISGADYAVAWFVKIFVEGKFYRLFSLLFGMGFALMLIRAEARGQPFLAAFSRRMGALFVFGLLHLVLLWSGDILHRYALGGLLLLGLTVLFRTPWLRRFDNNRLLLRVSVAAMALPFVVGSFVGFAQGLFNDRARLESSWQHRLKSEEMTRRIEADRRGIAGSFAHDGKVDGDHASGGVADAQIRKEALARALVRAQHRERVTAETVALTQPDYWTASRYRAEVAWRHLAEAPGFVIFPLLPIFLFGFWLVRSGTMHDPGRHLAIFRVVAWAGLVLGFAASVAAYTLSSHPATRMVDSFAILSFLLMQLGHPLLASGYFAICVLAMESPRWRTRLFWLAPLGRMALTNYLMHSLVLGMVFYGYGLGWFGQVSRMQQLLLVVAIGAAQAAFSRYWLARLRYGPMEWLWRSITRWRWQPLWLGENHSRSSMAK
ncbi:DUF418 domain-containing protein [Tahibacter sp.]|uniref:DUF418 domain-containing protein n=1 Tax=Tahibacter sp. TaxID=2056211 RepID=UPI0028C474C9|nr:DUF418 domain-containing protein [Tahibacter sp.]